MDILIPLLLGYFVGTINPAYLIARLKGFDIRSSGSGNAGGTNALLTMGSKVGVGVMVFDFLKAAALVLLCRYVFPASRFAIPIVSVSCIFGHIFPFYMHFRGGKGLASLLGAMFTFAPLPFLGVLVVELIILFSTRYLAYVPITASFIFPFFYGLLTKDYLGAVILIPIPVVIFWRHLINLKRIRSGAELRLNYLWKKEQETERVKKSNDNYM